LIRTAILFTTATIINIIINIYLGLQAAKRAGSLFDRSLAIAALVSYSLPMWWMGLILIYLFGYQYRIFPMSAKDVLNAIEKLNHMNIPPWEYFIRYIGVWAYYMALPIITILLVSFGAGAYVTRSMVLTVSREDFVLVARAKGLPERMVLYKHILRAASPPIVTGIVFGLIGSLGGAIISETVFQWPGMGYVYWIALQNSDASILLVNTWVTTILYIAAYFLLDFVYMLLDPRVRIGKGVE
jgi:peptide/nickel transport system permease protein